MQLADRSAHLVWIATVGMGLLASTIMFVALVRDFGLMGGVHRGLFSVPFAFFVGSYVGVFSSLVVALCLPRKNLKVALPFVYGPAFFAVVMYTALNQGERAILSSALIAVTSVCALSVIAIALPNARGPNPGLCPRCRYDLRGNFRAGCPECGWNRKDKEVGEIQA